MLSEDSIKELQGGLRGGLIEPGDKDYDEARKVYNGMIHKKPRLIARCADVADVIRSVNFARDNELLLAIRSGGHNAGGLGICDDGLVIDLAVMKYRSCYPCVWTCDSERSYFYDRSRRIDPGRRNWASHPQMRANH